MASASKRRSTSSELSRGSEDFDQFLSQAPLPRRNASLTLPRFNPSPLPRRLSLSLLPQGQHSQAKYRSLTDSPPFLPEGKRGIRNWKPFRMLTHIGMRRISCLFSVEVVAIRNLPKFMNGLRLTVCIRKNESRDGAVRAIPCRVLQGCAEFEEILFIQCNVHCNGGAATGKPIKLEPRLFLISVVAVDVAELELGRTIVDLSQLMMESIEGSFEGVRIRRWDASLEFSGKAEGGNLALRLGFQIMNDGGVGIYSRVTETGELKNMGFQSSFSARGSKNKRNSFSISTLASREIKMSVFRQSEIENFNDSEFQMAEKGTEKQIGLMKLDSIAEEMKNLESMMSKDLFITADREEKKLDASWETVIREFLQLLDGEANSKKQLKTGTFENQEAKALLSDLGSDLGPVIQTKDGGFLASMNPLNVEISRKATPKLAMQISKTFALRGPNLSSGLEVFRRLAAVGLEELSSKLSLLAAMDELQGKTAEQIAFEGIASAVISGWNREGTSSCSAKSIDAVKRMVSAMREDRKGRSLNDIWSIKDDSMLIDQILPFSMQRMENLALEALKVQADMAEEEASFDVSRLTGIENPNQILDSAMSLDEEEKTCEENKRITLLVLIQLRDPVRQYEAVGSPIIALIQAIRTNHNEKDDEQGRYRVLSLHVGGMKMIKSGDNRNAWDREKSKLTATQWLVANGMGKAGKKGRPVKSRLPHDLLWSLSSRIMEDMWLRPVRNPDV